MILESIVKFIHYDIPAAILVLVGANAVVSSPKNTLNVIHGVKYLC